MLINETIITFIQAKTGNQTINLNDNLLNHIKSFDFMLLIIELEQQFNISLAFEQAIANNIQNTKQFIHWVEQCHQNELSHAY